MLLGVLLAVPWLLLGDGAIAEQADPSTDTSHAVQDHQFVQSVAFTEASTTESSVKCGTTYESSSRSFHPHSKPLPWISAVTTCWEEGRQLAVPRSAPEARALGQLLLTFAVTLQEDMHDAIHVGIQSTAGLPLSSGSWRTIDGFQLSEAGYDLWLEGGEGDCGALLADGRYLRQPCHTRLPFACEDVPTQAQALANNYTHIPGAGLFRLHEEPLPWVLAQRRCEEEGASLAVPASGREAGLLAGVLVTRAVDTRVRQQGFFVGITDVAKEGAWRTVRGVELEAAGYATWAPDEPSDSRRENCGALLADGRYADYPCLAPLAFCCEARAGREGSDADVEVRGRYRLHKTPLPWFDALRACQRENATLVAPTRLQEKTDVRRLMTSFLHGSSDFTEYRYGLHREIPARIFVAVHDVDGNNSWTEVYKKTDFESSRVSTSVENSDGWNSSRENIEYDDEGNRITVNANARRSGNCAFMETDGSFGNIECTVSLPYVCKNKM